MSDFQRDKSDPTGPAHRISLARGSQSGLLNSQFEMTLPTAGRRATLRDVMAQALDGPDMTVTVAGLAAAAGMSRSRFARQFLLAFGETPIAFLKKERLRRAAHLLSSTPMSIKAVAAKTGFASRTSFAREFKKAFGIAPSVVSSKQRGRRHQEGEKCDDDALPSGRKRKNDLAEMQRRFSSVAPGGEPGSDALLSAYERLRAICSASLDVTWDIDLTTGSVWWSEGMLQAFGYGPDQVGPDTAWCHAHIHPDDRSRIAASMTEACERGDTFWVGEFRYRHADGSYVAVDDRGTIVRNGRGAAVRFVGAMRIIE